MMIKIRDDLFLAADSIVKVEVSSGLNISVVASDGQRHSVYNDYGKGAYATAERLNAEINAAQGAIEKKLDEIIRLLTIAGMTTDILAEVPHA